MEILHIFLTVSRYSEGRILWENIPTEFESGYKLWESLRQGRAGAYLSPAKRGQSAASPRHMDFLSPVWSISLQSLSFQNRTADH